MKCIDCQKSTTARAARAGRCPTCVGRAEQEPPLADHIVLLASTLWDEEVRSVRIANNCGGGSWSASVAGFRGSYEGGCEVEATGDTPHAALLALRAGLRRLVEGQQAAAAEALEKTR